jgi:hypothetical protein
VARAKDGALSVTIDPRVAERVRNAVDALSGPPLRLRLAGVVEEALIAWVGRVERQHGGGRTFPARPGAAVEAP